MGIDELEKSIQSIIDEAAKGNIAGDKERIKQLVPEYQPWLG